MSSDQSVYIVGLGLIGGSIARGLEGTSRRVVGWDRDSTTREQATEAGVVSELVEPENLDESVDIILLAVPVPAMVQVAERILESNSDRHIWTDVGSTKHWIQQQLRDRLPEFHTYVGGHPMAGSEDSGFQAGDPLLFENALCVLTGTTGDSAYESVRKLWEQLGAHVLQLDSLLHDRLVGHVSHLPHLTAAGLLNVLDDLPENRDHALSLAAGGFRDVTRIAEGDPELWKDILETNRPRIVESILALKEQLTEVERLLRDQQWDRLTDWLDQARRIRREIPEKTKGLLGTLHELRVQAPDRPGVLAAITGALGEAEINIRDLEVLRVREGELGTIRLAFREPEERTRAREVLEDADGGFVVI